MKANMAAALSELRNMQQLQDVLEQAQVSLVQAHAVGGTTKTISE